MKKLNKTDLLKTESRKQHHVTFAEREFLYVIITEDIDEVNPTNQKIVHDPILIDRDPVSITSGSLVITRKSYIIDDRNKHSNVDNGVYSKTRTIPVINGPKIFSDVDISSRKNNSDSLLREYTETIRNNCLKEKSDLNGNFKEISEVPKISSTGKSLKPIIKLKKKPRTESWDNPFLEDGELSRLADNIINNSTISRKRIRITDPDIQSPGRLTTHGRNKESNKICHNNENNNFNENNNNNNNILSNTNFIAYCSRNNDDNDDNNNNNNIYINNYNNNNNISSKTIDRTYNNGDDSRSFNDSNEYTKIEYNNHELVNDNLNTEIDYSNNIFSHSHSNQYDINNRLGNNIHNGSISNTNSLKDKNNGTTNLIYYNDIIETTVKTNINNNNNNNDKIIINNNSNETNLYYDDYLKGLCCISARTEQRTNKYIDGKTNIYRLANLSDNRFRDQNSSTNVLNNKDNSISLNAESSISLSIQSNDLPIKSTYDRFKIKTESDVQSDDLKNNNKLYDIESSNIYNIPTSNNFIRDYNSTSNSTVSSSPRNRNNSAAILKNLSSLENYNAGDFSSNLHPLQQETKSELKVIENISKNNPDITRSNYVSNNTQSDNIDKYNKFIMNIGNMNNYVNSPVTSSIISSSNNFNKKNDKNDFNENIENINNTAQIKKNLDSINNTIDKVINKNNKSVNFSSVNAIPLTDAYSINDRTASPDEYNNSTIITSTSSTQKITLMNKPIVNFNNVKAKLPIINSIRNNNKIINKETEINSTPNKKSSNKLEIDKNQKLGNFSSEEKMKKKLFNGNILNKSFVKKERKTANKADESLENSLCSLNLIDYSYDQTPNSSKYEIYSNNNRNIFSDGVNEIKMADLRIKNITVGNQNDRFLENRKNNSEFENDLCLIANKPNHSLNNKFNLNITENMTISEHTNITENTNISEKTNITENRNIAENINNLNSKIDVSPLILKKIENQISSNSGFKYITNLNEDYIISKQLKFKENGSSKKFKTKIFDKSLKKSQEKNFCCLLQ